MTASICIISRGNYWQERFVIEQALKNAGDMEVELLVYQVSGTGRKLLDFVDSLLERDEKNNLCSKEYPSLLRTATEQSVTSQAKAYNIMFDAAKCDYYCVLGSNCITKKSWLHDMCFTEQRLEKAGLISIPHALAKRRYFHIPDQAENNLLVCAPNSPSFTGAAIFNKRVREVFGGFNESETLYYEAFFEELKKNDFVNVSIPDQFLLHA